MTFRQNLMYDFIRFGDQFFLVSYIVFLKQNPTTWNLRNFRVRFPRIIEGRDHIFRSVRFDFKKKLF